MATVNFYTTTLAQSLTSGGSESEIYVNSIKSLDGQTIITSDFAALAKGYLTIDPQSSQRVERISFTAVDSVNLGFTGAVRGLHNRGGAGQTTANAFYHPVGSPVIIAFGADDWTDILAYIAGIVVGGTVNASTIVNGVVQLATQAQVDARTVTGSTGAYLLPPVTALRSTLLSDYTAETGGTNAYVISPTPSIAAYAIGQTFTFKPANTNTGASTLVVSGLAAKNIFYNGLAIGSGMLVAGGIVMVEYDGTQFQLVYTTQRVRTGFTTSSATPTINTDAVTYYELTAQAADITSFTTNLSGTPVRGQTLWIAITGTATRNITWGTSFESSTTTLPAATNSTNRLDCAFIWNVATSKWRIIALS
jgi:hypothetical protein